MIIAVSKMCPTGLCVVSCQIRHLESFEFVLVMQAGALQLVVVQQISTWEGIVPGILKKNGETNNYAGYIRVVGIRSVVSSAVGGRSSMGGSMQRLEVGDWVISG